MKNNTRKTRLEIIMRNTMPDGTKIQMEHWYREDGTYEVEIGAYPVAKETLNFCFVKGKTFRLTLVRLPQDKAADIYSDLIQGKMTIEDCVPYFHMPKDYIPALNLEVAA